jgi:hypothetical protein
MTAAWLLDRDELALARRQSRLGEHCCCDSLTHRHVVRVLEIVYSIAKWPFPGVICVVDAVSRTLGCYRRGSIE